MKKQINNRGFYVSPGIFKSLSFYFFISIVGLFKTVLEVFFKRHMGERHFSKATAAIWIVALFALPFFLSPDKYLAAKYIMLNNWFWYLFVLAFIVFSVIRLKQSWRPTGVFDLTSYSRSHGFSYEFFYRIKWRGKTPTTRIVDVCYEPLSALLAGILIYNLFHKGVGILIILCAICYFLYYYASYAWGDDMILDIFDDVIVNQDRSETLNTGRPAQSGYKFMGEVPESDDLREMLNRYIGRGEDDDESGMIV